MFFSEYDNTIKFKNVFSMEALSYCPETKNDPKEHHLYALVLYFYC